MSLLLLINLFMNYNSENVTLIAFYKLKEVKESEFI